MKRFHYLAISLAIIVLDAFTKAPDKRDVKIGRGTHLLHLEANRAALWRESIAFLDPSRP